MRTMKFPENNEGLLIIPSNIKGTGFLRTCYDEKILKGFMEVDEFQSVLDAASKVVARVYSRKRLADTAGIEQYKIYLLSASMVLALLFMMMIYFAILYDSAFFEVGAYTIILSAFLIVLPLSLFECLRKSDNKFISFNLLVKKELDAFLLKINPVY